MTIGIYIIQHRESGKAYVGKSVDVRHRLWTHKSTLQKRVFNRKTCNRHLWNAVQKYGWAAFQTSIVEIFDEVDEKLIGERELWWMDMLRTCERPFGYNLRRDTSTKMVVHEETRTLRHLLSLGSMNPNFGNKWSPQQRQRMSEIQKMRHATGCYSPEWRERANEVLRSVWRDASPEKKAAMGRKVAASKRKYDYLQFTREGQFVRRWESVEQIVAANPEYKWQNIYNVCHGHKPTYRGFVWKQELK